MGSFDNDVAVFGLHRVYISWVVLIMMLQYSGYTGCIFHRAVLIMALQCSGYTGCILHRAVLRMTLQCSGYTGCIFHG